MSESVDIKVKRRNPIWILSTFAGLESELSKLGKRMSLDPNLTTSDVIHMLAQEVIE